MILGIGVDAVSIERASRLGNAFTKRWFSPSENDELAALSDAALEIRAQFIASRFAVKEAYAKARGTGFCQNVVPSEISVSKDGNGKPCVVLSGRTAEGTQGQRVNVSITHEAPLAIAFVTIEEA